MTKQGNAPEPQISDTPVISGTGSVYWNVRDIVFGANRSAPRDDPKRDVVETTRQE